MVVIRFDVWVTQSHFTAFLPIDTNMDVNKHARVSTNRYQIGYILIEFVSKSQVLIIVKNQLHNISIIQRFALHAIYHITKFFNQI